MADKRVIVFTGGGTGGHIYPGLAVIEELKKNFSGRIVWLGSKKETDRRVVEAAGIEYMAVPAGKLRRSFSFQNAADAFRVLAGFFASRALLKKLAPSLVFSKGGYVSVPPCRAAASLGIPVFTHESDYSPGLATRLNARGAERILLSYAQTAALLAPELRAKTLVLGNPVRAAIGRGDPALGRSLLGADRGGEAGLPILLFLGGSQGARQVNDLVHALLPSLLARAVVVHQRGEAEAQEGGGGKGSAGGGDGKGSAGGADGLPASTPFAERYHPYPYIRDELPHILAAADLVIGRSGAGTVWEAGALGKPMVLIPLAGSGTRGDQVDNARLFEKAGAAIVLVGAEATPAALEAAIAGFLDDEGRRRAAGMAAKNIAGGEAATAAATLILERIGGKA